MEEGGPGVEWEFMLELDGNVLPCESREICFVWGVVSVQAIAMEVIRFMGCFPSSLADLVDFRINTVFISFSVCVCVGGG